MRFTVLTCLLALAAFLLLCWLWAGEEAPEEGWQPALAEVCEITAQRHPTHLRCEARDGVVRTLNCGAVGDRPTP